MAQVTSPTDSPPLLDFRTGPVRYRHWRLDCDGGPIAELKLQVDPLAPAIGQYELKLNSYDIGVDIELYDAVQRLRFEHPEVRCVVLTSARPGTFCAGANIRMLGQASHGHKLNFCKFTNETRNAIEDASACSGQKYLAAVNGAAAGGGYELALACDHLLLIDDGNAAVSLPEVPLLAVLPGTGGLTRLVDKRKVRRDLADVFCTIEEGVKGRRALEWNLVDELASGSQFAAAVQHRAAALAAISDRPGGARGIDLGDLDRTIDGDEIRYATLRVALDRGRRHARLTLFGPSAPAPASVSAAKEQGAMFWPLALARDLDDALLHLRFNEPLLGTLILETEGDASGVLAHDHLLQRHADDWFIREVLLYWKRTCKRLDLTARTLFGFVTSGSCFAGLLAELLFAVDRGYMWDGGAESPAITLSELNFGPLPMANGLTRLATRFLGAPERIEELHRSIGTRHDARQALAAGLVTFAPDDIDWDDEIRVLLEERAAYSPDALSAMEANLRFAGPETMETKIFARLSAWQNWIFQRPNAVGDAGAIRRYGTGLRPEFDRTRT